MKTILSVAALAALLTGGSVAAVQAADTVLAGPTAYMQMNSPGDGISSGAARTGNGRRGGMRHHRHRHHHWHHRRRHR